ncbi:MAG TPA: AAA family ATPase [Solirubrobacteraceae bacterium]|nr:AAA family ATPase [Solirubrobacteraceae bacterium]HUA44733.1 AAA family ATPase [Solirubrobacteraceae bacterium]
MPVREAPDRRGRPLRGRRGLLERESPLQAIAAALDSIAAGDGAALLLEGHAGMGKTRLHEAALDEGRRLGMRVLRAAGAELEQNLAFGVAGQLVRALVADLRPEARQAFLAEAPERVRSLAGAGENLPELEDAGDLTLSHGLFTVMAGAAETRPTLLALDDLHWCDVASLEFVLYVLHRLDELPAAIVMTRRPGVGDGSTEALDLIASHPRVHVESLTPLGAEAAQALAREAFGERAEPALAQVSVEVTSGNPFYLHELLVALAEEPDASGPELTRRARALAPDAVIRSLRVRVGRLGPDAAALGRAVAILGDDVPLRRAAALAGLEIDAASAAADALARVEVLLAREPLRFVHPLVQHAIEQDIPLFERSTRHLDAARLLYAEGEEVERVAAHLLLAHAGGDPWVVERLRAAAREARAAQPAARYLERALEEPPAAELRPEVLAELGAAEAALGKPDAADHLAQAAAASSDPRRRAELALQLGRALDAQGRHERAAMAYDAALSELVDEPSDPDELELRDQLEASFISTASIVPDLQPVAVARSTRVIENAVKGPRTQGQRLLLAQTALHSTTTGESAHNAVELAERAWDGGRILGHAHAEWIGWRMVAAAFLLNGELESAIEVTDAALEDARQRAWPLAFATASHVRGLPRLWQGRVTDAVVDLELARDARRYGWQEFARSAAAHYALCLTERGELERAEEVLAEDGPLDDPRDIEDVLRVYSLAELRLAQARPREALEAALLVGQIGERTVRFLGYCPWRTTAAQAALLLGERDRAFALADEELARAERTDVLHLRIRARRVVGLCEQGTKGIRSLRAAAQLGADAPPRLETLRALIDLGAALRRENRRTEARQPLAQAADMASHGGAVALHERARGELAATGARPRRDVLLSGPESLTPSERRIAELAATGQSNREIAQALFVTPKTVEYHLRNTYRKLDIQTRRELAEALSV